MHGPLQLSGEQQQGTVSLASNSLTVSVGGPQQEQGGDRLYLKEVACPVVEAVVWEVLYYSLADSSSN